MTDTKSFECSCRWPFHRLHIWPDDELPGELFPHLYVTVVNAPADLNIWQRLRMAWDTLLGKEHLLSEIILDSDGTKELIDYVCSIPHNPNTA